MHRELANILLLKFAQFFHPVRPAWPWHQLTVPLRKSVVPAADAARSLRIFAYEERLDLAAHQLSCPRIACFEGNIEPGQSIGSRNLRLNRRNSDILTRQVNTIIHRHLGVRKQIEALDDRLQPRPAKNLFPHRGKPPVQVFGYDSLDVGLRYPSVAPPVRAFEKYTRAAPDS